MADLIGIRSNWTLGISYFLLSILSAIALKHADANASLAPWCFTIIFGYSIYGILHYTYPKELPAWCEVFANFLSLIVQLLTLAFYTNDAVMLQAANDQSLQLQIFWNYIILLIVSVIYIICIKYRYYYIKSLTIITFIIWNLVILIQIQHNDWQEYSWYNGMILLLILNNLIVTTFFNLLAISELHLIVNSIKMAFFTIFAFKSLNELAASLNQNSNNKNKLSII